MREGHGDRSSGDRRAWHMIVPRDGLFIVVRLSCWETQGARGSSFDPQA